MKNLTRSFALLLSLLCIALDAGATPILGAELAAYSVLAGVGGATNTPTEYPHAGVHTVLSNNLGTSNGAASGVTGFWGALQDSGPGIVRGGVTQGSGAAVAQVQLVAAMATLQGMRTANTVEYGDLSGMTLLPGTYSLSAPAFNLGVGQTLTLDGGGKADAAWVFLATSSIIMGTDSSVKLINAGPGASVFWNAVSSITLNGGAQMLGNFLADTSITMLADANIVCGRALGHTGNVTMSSNAITSSGCFGSTNGFATSDGLDGTTTLTTLGLAAAASAAAAPPPYVPHNDHPDPPVDTGTGTTPPAPATTPPAPQPATVPEPSSVLLMLAALAGMAWMGRRQGA